MQMEQLLQVNYVSDDDEWQPTRVYFTELLRHYYNFFTKWAALGGPEGFILSQVSFV